MLRISPEEHPWENQHVRFPLFSGNQRSFLSLQVSTAAQGAGAELSGGCSTLSPSHPESQLPRDCNQAKCGSSWAEAGEGRWLEGPAHGAAAGDGDG